MLTDFQLFSPSDSAEIV